jgi:hypothetical protein
MKSTPRDVFMYLLATITLYFVAFSVIDLLFGYINIAFPDALNPYYDAGGAIRWSLALLIIIFPVYFWTSRFLEKDIAKEPAKNDLKIRKWLLYLTLFLAALLIIGDLVALIFNFLQGEITVRFFSKVIAVLIVAGAIFWFYLYDLRRAPGVFSGRAKAFVWGSIVAYLAIVVAGVLLAGSPFQQRLVRFDQQKTSDLQVIQSQVLNYWTQKGSLPTTLGDLKDSISGFQPPVDPQSGQAYEYIKTGATSFQLCANFNVAANGASDARGVPAVPSGYYEGLGTNESWMHDTGRQCFDRTIDTQLYPPKPQVK